MHPVEAVIWSHFGPSAIILTRGIDMVPSWYYALAIMKHTKRSIRKTQQNLPTIKIYTTQDIVEAFMARAAEQSRSVSKHGEFLVKQDLAAAMHKVA